MLTKQKRESLEIQPIPDQKEGLQQDIFHGIGSPWGSNDVAFGNVVGSNISNILFILGNPDPPRQR